MSWYREGVITLTNGSKTVTGTGTAWLENVVESSGLKTPIGPEEIESITSDTVLQLVVPYAGPTISNVAYSIIPTQGLVPALTKKVGALLGSVGVVKDAFAAGDLASSVDLEKRATLVQLAATGGSALMGYDGGTLQDVADYAKPLQSFVSLRAYTGRAKSVRITTPGIAGTFVLDAGDSTTADNGGTVIVDASGRRWKRQMSGLSASPLWFGIPLNSSGVDYTAGLQALLDTKNFVFPEGFTASCTTLYPRSNSVGDFKNAVFKLMPGMPSGTQVMVLGTPANLICENAIFYGGTLDGNRAEQTANGNVGIAGGDGGLHGLQIHHARNVRWYSPKCINAGTDGIIAWERANTVIDEVHIYSPVCHNNARQGFSGIRCTNLNFYDGVFSGTNGKAPQSGIDLEGNAATDTINVNFYGRTLCINNVSRGFMCHSPGNTVRATFDTLEILDNQATDAQLALYVSKNGGVNNVTARSIQVSGGKGVLVSQDAVAVNVPTHVLKIEEMTSTDTVFLFGSTVLDMGTIKGTAATLASAVATVLLGDDVTGRIRYIEATNTGNTTNSYCVRISGALGLEIIRILTKGARALAIVAGSNKTVRSMECTGALLSYGLRISNGSTKNRVSMVITGTVASEYGASIDASSDNDVELEWRGASRGAVVVLGASARNRIKVISDRSSAGPVVAYAAEASANMAHSCSLANPTGTGLVSDAGTGNKVYGSWPPAINSAS